MAEGGKTGFFQRLSEDVHSTRRFVQAKAAGRRLAADRGKLESDLLATYHEIGDQAAGAPIGQHLPAFADVLAARKKLSEAQDVQAERKSSLQEAQAILAAETKKHSQILDALAAERKQAAEAAAAAKAELDASAKAVRSIEGRIQEQTRAAQAGSTGSGIRPQVADLGPARAAAQEALAGAKQRHAQTASVLEAKSAQVARAKAAADQAKTPCEANLAAAKAADAAAAQALESARSTLGESLRRFGRAVFEAGLTGEPIAAATVKARSLGEAIRSTDVQIAAAKAQADAARGGTKRFAMVAGGVAGALAVLVVGIVLLVGALTGRPTGSGGSAGRTPNPPVLAAPAEPNRSVEWPTVQMEKVIDKDGGVLEDPSGIQVTVRANTFSQRTRVSVRTTTAPAVIRNDIPVKGPILELATDPPTEGLFNEPVRVTLPFQGPAEKGLTAAYWTGSTWRRVGARLDPKTSSLSFDTMSFSTYTVTIQDWDDWPVLFIEDPTAWNPPAREAPRGSVVRVMMKLKGVPPAGLSLDGSFSAVQSAPGSAVEVAPDPDIPAAFAPKGRARIKPDTEVSRWTRYLDSKVTWVTFLVHVPEDAPLGPHNLYLTADAAGEDYKKLGWPKMVRRAIEVSNRKAFLLVIDGLHSKIFEKALTDPWGMAPPNLGLLFGSPTPKQRDVEAVSLRPSRAGPNAEAVSAIRLRSGYIFPRATTIFPSYTFAGNAAIATGRSVGEFGIPGNEWFNRNATGQSEQRRYSFTGAYASGRGVWTGQVGFMDPVRSYWDVALANNVLRTDTLYQEVCSGELAPLGLKNLVSIHMYFGKSQGGETNRLWTDFLTQFTEFQLSSHGIDFDKDMVSKACTALGHSPGVLAAPAAFISGGQSEPVEGFGSFFSAVGRFWLKRFRQFGAQGGRWWAGFWGGDAKAQASARSAGVVTLYFASLDHAGHAHYGHPTVQSVHEAMLIEHIDPMIGEFLKCVDDAVLVNSLWVVVSDHGQSDMGHLVEPQMYLRLEGPYKVENAWRITPAEYLPLVAPKRSVEDSDCAIAYDSGLAHVYVRHSKDSPTRERSQWSSWSECLASPSEVYGLASQTILYEARRKWKGMLDVILLRLPKDVDLKYPGLSNEPMTDASKTEYYVMDPAGEDGAVVRLAQYLENPDPRKCVFYQQRYGWTPADKAFLLDAIQSLNSDRTGDVVVLPKYPDYYFEYGNYLGNHGGLVKDDMECTLGVAIPGIDMKKNKQLEKLATESIDLVRKPRVGNRDVRDFIVNYYKQKGEYRRAPVTTGPLHIRCVLAAGTGTAIEITSEDLGKLDPKAGSDEGLVFFLYRSDDPKAAFPASLEARKHAVKIFGDAKVVNPDTYDFTKHPTGRIAPNKCQILDGYDASGDTPPGASPGPFYYQVGQVRIDRNGNELGSEVRSNIAGPDPAFIHVLLPPHGPQEDIATFVGDPQDGWGLIAAALRIPNQLWACDGAEILAESGNWKGHFYTGRAENGKTYGVESVADTGGMARVTVPFPSQAGYVKLTAKGKGLTAERTLKLEAKTPAAQTRPATAPPAENPWRKQAAELKARLDETRQDFAKSDRKSADDQVILAKLQLDVDLMEKVTIPAGDAAEALEKAKQSFDHTQVIDALSKLLALIETRIELEAACKRQVLALYQAAQGAAGIADFVKKDYENKCKDLQDELSRVVLNHAAAREQFYDDIAKEALLVGDAGLFHQAMVVVVAAREIRKEDTTASLRAFANGTAMLSGNREEAAKLWLAADKQELDASPADQREGLLKGRQSRSGPAWWPPSDDGKSLTPADIEGMNRANPQKPAPPTTP